MNWTPTDNGERAENEHGVAWVTLTSLGWEVEVFDEQARSVSTFSAETMAQGKTMAEEMLTVEAMTPRAGEGGR